MNVPLRRPYISGAFPEGNEVREIRSPWDGRVVARVSQAGPGEAAGALAAAFAARRAGQALPAGRRRELCEGVANGIRERAEELARSICDEAGKPIAIARAEVKRAIATFTLAAAEATRFAGKVVPIDLDPATVGYEAITRRVPAGVVVAISPFNFPLNLGAHKVAPALAVGSPVIWKPPPQAPSAACILAEIVHGLGVPDGLFQVVPCGNEVAEILATDRRVAILSFTGSAPVGWALKAKSGRAKVVLELGGNAAAIVCADANLAWAARRCAHGGMVYAGQVCIAVQRIYVEASVYEAFRETLRAEVDALKVGDPSREDTVVGPVIDEGHAKRIESWIDEAKWGGATVHGGGRRGSFVLPTILEKVPSNARITCEEVFGPVILLEPFDDFDAVLGAVNESQYGLQAGVFTDSLARTRKAWRELEVGGVIVNDYPTFRQDNMPYGGVKASGLGREGLSYAMEDYTEPRVLVLSGRA
ncbi:aldehyde dehydrogenase family protein [Vulgatibacter incomptus]|uniref:Aldehyde dehydrogenase n=1 Tax=Vulgatibacter incomptus TaxID=1391653 RepID=A0A0K1PFJ8_9BACT|nr:aldehyde dehydrogenase family protein [Vulgatibacter incomptus]AKU91889.1 Aldehyde dehydrogenase [Vulgatibacter incomptus]